MVLCKQLLWNIKAEKVLLWIKKKRKKKPASPEKLIVCSGNLAKEGNLEICSVKAGSGFRGESTKPE